MRKYLLFIVLAIILASTAGSCYKDTCAATEVHTFARVTLVEAIDQDDFDILTPIVQDSTLIEVQVDSTSTETRYGTLTTYIWE